MKTSTEKPASYISFQLQAEGLDQCQSIEAARNFPRHKRQLQSQILLTLSSLAGNDEILHGDNRISEADR